MFYGLSHVELVVKSLERGVRFYREALGFPEKKRGPGYVDLEAGAVTVRLVEGTLGRAPARVRLYVSDVAAALAVVEREGGRRLYDPMRTPELEEIAVAHDPDGNVLIVHRPLTEDEYDFVPELPKQGGWHPEGEELMKSLLSHVPALFRALARRKVTRVAEELAAEERAPLVGREHVIRGYILASARVTRARTRAPLAAHGIDPDRYRADFEA